MVQNKQLLQLQGGGMVAWGFGGPPGQGDQSQSDTSMVGTAPLPRVSGGQGYGVLLALPWQQETASCHRADTEQGRGKHIMRNHEGKPSNEV